MSMSQEEIEALMNGLEISDDTNEPEEVVETAKVNTKEIEELLSQTEEVKEEINSKEEVFDLESFGIESDSQKEIVDSTEIDELLKDIESSASLQEVEKDEEVQPKQLEETVQKNNSVTRSEDDIVKDWTSSKINEGVFPLPAEKDTKVVNQLTQVANDSEEKVSQIFDVLSLTLDNNNELRRFLKDYEKFLNSQSNLLLSLNNKFPNIKVFDEHLSSVKLISNSLSGLKDLLQAEDNQIFQAMELMQFNDINRQKIERVMSVIRKLSLYLNNLFEDDSGAKDIAVARHIHGDDTDDLIGDDLDKLIAEFSNNK
ncbi:hypothetical protein CP963_06750 [Arcobacter cloacae]|uniref:Uncharacterized protein n=2 Tax=Arcobacter cloacae TaxID=1054034 RepID=A0A6M8NN93_9BACT|nr:hypothetical protein ACLO_2223 [Arcobacter cloacae]RXI41462.1 hypothetical protein CP963_06750 [Arcobacter cloacae]